ncbi:OsmC family protein [Bacteroidota bacterium]
MIQVKSNNNKYQCEVSNGRFVMKADATKDKGGMNEGFRPHELLEAAFATCLNMSVRMRADKLGIKVIDVYVEVEVNKEHPTETFFNYKLEIDGDLSIDERTKLNETAKICAVHNTLMKNLSFKKKLT